jgi:hypothetical protein
MVTAISVCSHLATCFDVLHCDITSRAVPWENCIKIVSRTTQASLIYSINVEHIIDSETISWDIVLEVSKSGTWPSCAAGMLMKERTLSTETMPCSTFADAVTMLLSRDTSGREYARPKPVNSVAQLWLLTDPAFSTVTAGANTDFTTGRTAE